MKYFRVQVENAQQQLFELTCEATAGVVKLSWMSQVTARLPDTLGGAGELGDYGVRSGQQQSAVSCQLNSRSPRNYERCKKAT